MGKNDCFKQYVALQALIIIMVQRQNMQRSFHFCNIQVAKLTSKAFSFRHLSALTFNAAAHGDSPQASDMHPLWAAADHEEMHTFGLTRRLNKPGWRRLTQAFQEQSLKSSEISSHFTSF